MEIPGVMSVGTGITSPYQQLRHEALFFKLHKGGAGIIVI